MFYGLNSVPKLEFSSIFFNLAWTRGFLSSIHYITLFLVFTIFTMFHLVRLHLNHYESRFFCLARVYKLTHFMKVWDES